MSVTVRVDATWTSQHRFEFDTPEQAEEFAAVVNRGDLEGLIDHADSVGEDITSSGAELTDFEAAVGRPH